MDILIRELGQELVDDSKAAESFSAQRGLIDELFPYVYEASRRMSSRAISRWLQEKGFKLSPATIAKALRESEDHWRVLAEEMEPAARIFSDAHDISLRDVWTNEGAVSLLAGNPPIVERQSLRGVSDSLSEIAEAEEKLRMWFSLPESAREACLANAEIDLGDSNPPTDESEDEVQ